MKLLARLLTYYNILAYITFKDAPVGFEKESLSTVTRTVMRKNSLSQQESEKQPPAQTVLSAVEASITVTIATTPLAA